MREAIKKVKEKDIAEHNHNVEHVRLEEHVFRADHQGPRLKYHHVESSQLVKDIHSKRTTEYHARTQNYNGRKTA